MSFYTDSERTDSSEREMAASTYRERARELRARSRRSRSEQLAKSFIAIAEAYELLADSAAGDVFSTTEPGGHSN